MRHKGLKYLSLVVLLERGGDQVLNLEEGKYQGYEEFPVFVGRYYTMPGEVLGRSPAFDCIDDVKVLQRLQYYYDLAIPTAINPPLKDREGNLQRKSGGVDNPTIKPGDYLTFEQPELCTPLIQPANFSAAEVVGGEAPGGADQVFWMNQPAAGEKIHDRVRGAAVRDCQRTAGQADQQHQRGLARSHDGEGGEYSAQARKINCRAAG